MFSFFLFLSQYQFCQWRCDLDWGFIFCNLKNPSTSGINVGGTTIGGIISKDTFGFLLLSPRIPSIIVRCFLHTISLFPIEVHASFEHSSKLHQDLPSQRSLFQNLRDRARTLCQDWSSCENGKGVSYLCPTPSCQALTHSAV